MAIHRFAFPTTIHFGAGARTLVPTYLKDAGCKRPLIVTDKGIAARPVLDNNQSRTRCLGQNPLLMMFDR